MVEKKRIEWIDMAKGYGMIAVILGHIISYSLLRSWIYTFHIPLFFFISGYVVNINDSFSVFIKKKIKSIIIPYFCLGIVIFIFSSFMSFRNGTLNPNTLLKAILNLLIQKRQFTLWFLACLLFLNLLFYCFAKLLKTNLKLFFLSILLIVIGAIYYYLGGKPLPWNIDVCMMAFPFFFAGYWLKKSPKTFNSLFNNRHCSFFLFLLFGSLNILCGYLSLKISGKGLEMFHSSYGVVPLTYISAFSGIICVIYISNLITIKPIRYIGENSLIYFAWHQSIMIPIAIKTLSILNFSKSLSEINILTKSLYTLSELLIIVLLCTLCNIIISKTKLKFMIGKK